MAGVLCHRLLVISALAFLVSPCAARAEEPAMSPDKRAATNPSPPRPIRLADWVSTLDYPSTALRLNATGIVTFQIDVAKNGLPRACEVIGSSGNGDLDKTTCQLIMKRARFVPATDESGKPVPGKYRGGFKWQLPEEPPALPAQSQLIISYDVLLDGSTSNCHVTASGRILAKLPDDPQSLCKTLGKFAPQYGANGKPARKHVVLQNTVVVTDAP